MNVTCPECSSIFRVNPAAVPQSGVRARCSVCGGVLLVGKTGAISDDFMGAPVPRGAPAARAAAPAAPAQGAGARESGATRPPAPPAGARPAPPSPPPQRPPSAEVRGGRDHRDERDHRDQREQPRRTPPFAPRQADPRGAGGGAVRGAPEQPPGGAERKPEAPPHGPPGAGEGSAPATFTWRPPAKAPGGAQAPEGAPRRQSERPAAGQPAAGAPRRAEAAASSAEVRERKGAPQQGDAAGARFEAKGAQQAGQPLRPPAHATEPPAGAANAGAAPASGQNTAPGGGHGPGAAGGAAPAARRPINPFLASDPNMKAKRLARALVSDIVVYFPQKHQEGLRNGNLPELFREEIKKSYEEYVEQMGKEFAESTTHFQDALNDVLAGGKKLFGGLGPG